MNRDAQPPPTPPGDHEIEAFLAGNQFQVPPREWREEILARALTPALAPTEAPAHSCLPWIRCGWQNALDHGWGIVAAAWVLILTLNLFATHSIRPSANTPPPLSASALAELRAQQRALADTLAHVVRSPEAAPPPKAEPNWPPTPGRPRAGTARPLIPPNQASRAQEARALCASPSPRVSLPPRLRVSASPRRLPSRSPLPAPVTRSAPTPPPSFV